jgi:hypothetical protein
MFLKPIDFYVGAMLVLAVFLRVTETAARCALCLWTMALLSKYIVAGFVTFSANVVRALVTERML